MALPRIQADPGRPSIYDPGIESQTPPASDKFEVIRQTHIQLHVPSKSAPLEIGAGVPDLTRVRLGKAVKMEWSRVKMEMLPVKIWGILHENWAYQVEMWLITENWNYDMNADIWSGIEDGARGHKSWCICSSFCKGMMGANEQRKEDKLLGDGNYDP